MTKNQFPHISQLAQFTPTTAFIGDVYVNDNCAIGQNVTIDGSSGRIVVFEGCSIGDGTIIRGGEERINIGKNSRIGMNCLISISIEENSVIPDDAILS